MTIQDKINSLKIYTDEWDGTDYYDIDEVKRIAKEADEEIVNLRNENLLLKNARDEAIYIIAIWQSRLNEETIEPTELDNKAMEFLFHSGYFNHPNEEILY